MKRGVGFRSALIIAAAACGCVEPLPGTDRADTGLEPPLDMGFAEPDSGEPPADAGVPSDDAGSPNDAGITPVVANPNVSVVSGGGVGASTNFRARVVISAPTRAESASSPSYRATIGLPLR